MLFYTHAFVSSLSICIQADDHEPAKPTFFVAGETTDDLEDSTTVPSSAIPVPVDLATSGEGLCDSV